MAIKIGTTDKMRDLLDEVKRLEAERDTFYKALNNIRRIASGWVYTTVDGKAPIALYMHSAFCEIEKCGKEAITNSLGISNDQQKSKASL